MIDWIWPVLAAPFAGSFLGVVIARLPEGRPVVVGRSACEVCGARLRPRDLVPLLSFAVLRGRCRRCGGPIASFHWRVELAAVAVVASALAAGSRPPGLWLDCGLGWTLLALAWIDARCMLLPDVLTLPLLLAGLGVTQLTDPATAAEHAIASAFAYTALRGLGLAYRRLRGRDGIGEGDAKLLAALGAWVGLEGLPSVILGAAVAGLLGALSLRLRGREMNAATAIPFGPFLALAGWVVWLVR